MRSRKPQRREIVKEEINKLRGISADVSVKTVRDYVKPKDYCGDVQTGANGSREPTKIDGSWLAMERKAYRDYKAKRTRGWWYSKFMPDHFRRIKSHIAPPRMKKYKISGETDDGWTKEKIEKQMENGIDVYNSSFICYYCGEHYLGPWPISHGPKCKHPDGIDYMRQITEPGSDDDDAPDLLTFF